MKYERIIEELNNVVPKIATTTLNLFTNLDKCSAEFIWYSSNEEVISSYGNVARFTPVHIVYYGNDFVLAENYVAYKTDKKGKKNSLFYRQQFHHIFIEKFGGKDNKKTAPLLTERGCF